MQPAMIQYLGEFLGTFLLVLLGNGVVSAVLLNKTKATGTNWVAIALGWGFALMVAIYVASFMSPAHLNPAITLGMALIGKFKWSLVFGFILAQFLGAMVASLFLWLHYYPHYQETEDPAAILGTFSTGPALRHTPSNFFGEVIGTFILVAAILALGQSDLADGLMPTLIGGVITAIGFSLGATTGYSLNPARDLGPRIMHAILPIKNKGNSDWSYSWIPVVGPIVGGVLGAIILDLIIKAVNK